MTRRIERVNHLLRQEIGELLRHQVKDPRLSSFIAITEVSITPDLKHAKIFVSHMGSQEEREATLNALAGASGFLRNHLARQLKLKRIPELDFQWDDSIERGAHLLELINEVSTDNTLD